MPRLQTLLLNDTSLEEWPASVFRVPRPENFILDMRQNPIARIPEFAPGSDKALIVAKPFLTREELTPELLAQFKRYIEAAGRRSGSPVAQERGAGQPAVENRLFGAGVALQASVVWDMLEESFGLRGFFQSSSCRQAFGGCDSR